MGIKITKIESLDIIEPAYDITVHADQHTLPLAKGVYVHNCAKIPKQYFNYTDGGGFDSGKSLAIQSATYAKFIKKIQNVLIQMITDLINLFLINADLPSYLNKFYIRMQAPTTQEEIDRRESVASKVSLIKDIMDMASDVDDKIARLKLLKALLPGVLTDGEAVEIIQDQIDKLEQEQEEQAQPETPPDDAGTNDFDMSEPLNLTSDGSFDTSGTNTQVSDEMSTGEDLGTSQDTTGYTLPYADEVIEDDLKLPTPGELNAGDFSNNVNPLLIG